MKTHFNYIVCLLLTLFAVSSCERDVAEQAANILATPTKMAVDKATPYVCLGVNAHDVAFTFSWTEADFGTNISRTYILQFDIKGRNFSNPVELIAGTNIAKKAVLSSELNSIMHALGLPIETPTDLDVRVVARPMIVGTENPNIPTAISDTKVIVNGTSFLRSGMHMIGSMFDEYLNNDKFFWSNTNYQYIMFRDHPLDISDICITRYLHFTGNGLRGEMAFIEDTKLGEWVTINKDGEGTLKYGGSNIKIATEAYYTVKIDISKMTYSMETYDASNAKNYTIVKLTGTGVSSDVQLTQSHYDPHIWTADNVALTTNEVTFNLDGSSWSGDIFPWGKATKDGASVSISEAGTYFVKYSDLTGHYVFYKK